MPRSVISGVHWTVYISSLTHSLQFFYCTEMKGWCMDFWKLNLCFQRRFMLGVLWAQTQTFTHHLQMILYFRLIEMDKDLDLFQVCWGGGGGGGGGISEKFEWIKRLTLINFLFCNPHKVPVTFFAGETQKGGEWRIKQRYVLEFKNRCMYSSWLIKFREFKWIETVRPTNLLKGSVAWDDFLLIWSYLCWRFKI